MDEEIEMMGGSLTCPRCGYEDDIYEYNMEHDSRTMDLVEVLCPQCLYSFDLSEG